TFKSRVKNSTYRIWLEAEEARCNGDIQKAIRMIDEQMPKLRGLKLLSASEYRKELEQDLALAQ
ncbi:MAG: hypothetical protein Q8898_15680, partial [Bacillota bacterium]|nr:hypothetical protein [Bacillota bacterium]